MPPIHDISPRLATVYNMKTSPPNIALASERLAHHLFFIPDQEGKPSTPVPLATEDLYSDMLAVYRVGDRGEGDGVAVGGQKETCAHTVCARCNYECVENIERQCCGGTSSVQNAQSCHIIVVNASPRLHRELETTNGLAAAWRTKQKY